MFNIQRRPKELQSHGLAENTLIIWQFAISLVS